MTIPGERLMNANFGVGLQTFLFEAMDTGASTITSSITNAIDRQVRTYLPFINIEDIQFSFPNEGDLGVMGMRLLYSIPSLAQVPQDADGAINYINFELENGEVQIDYDSYVGNTNSGYTDITMYRPGP